MFCPIAARWPSSRLAPGRSLDCLSRLGIPRPAAAAPSISHCVLARLRCRVSSGRPAVCCVASLCPYSACFFPLLLYYPSIEPLHVERAFLYFEAIAQSELLLHVYSCLPGLTLSPGRRLQSLAAALLASLPFGHSTGVPTMSISTRPPTGSVAILTQSSLPRASTVPWLTRVSLS